MDIHLSFFFWALFSLGMTFMGMFVFCRPSTPPRAMPPGASTAPTATWWTWRSTGCGSRLRWRCRPTRPLLRWVWCTFHSFLPTFPRQEITRDVRISVEGSFKVPSSIIQPVTRFSPLFSVKMVLEQTRLLTFGYGCWFRVFVTLDCHSAAANRRHCVWDEEDGRGWQAKAAGPGTHGGVDEGRLGPWRTTRPVMFRNVFLYGSSNFVFSLTFSSSGWFTFVDYFFFW